MNRNLPTMSLASTLELMSRNQLTINLDSLLEYLPAGNIRIAPYDEKVFLKLLGGPDDKVKDASYDKETQTFHLTLDVCDDSQAGIRDMYAAYIPMDTRSIVVDDVVYHSAETIVQVPDIPDFTQD